MSKLKLTDLVILTYSPNACYTSVHDGAKPIKDLAIDLEKRTWSYSHWTNIRIGQSRSPYHQGHKIKEGVIGVYNRNDTKQLDSMVGDAKEATREESYSED